MPFFLGPDLHDPTMHGTGDAVVPCVLRGSYERALLAKLLRQGIVNERNPASRPFSLVTGNKLPTAGTLNSRTAALGAFGPSPTLAFKRQFCNAPWVLTDK